MMLLALPQPGRRRPRRRARAGLRRLELEQRAERQAEHAGAADAEHIAPSGPQVSIAQIFAARTDDSKHG